MFWIETMWDRFFTKCNDMENDFMSQKRKENKMVSMQFNNHKS